MHVWLLYIYDFDRSHFSFQVSVKRTVHSLFGSSNWCMNPEIILMDDPYEYLLLCVLFPSVHSADTQEKWTHVCHRKLGFILAGSTELRDMQFKIFLLMRNIPCFLAFFFPCERFDIGIYFVSWEITQWIFNSRSCNFFICIPSWVG